MYSEQSRGVAGVDDMELPASFNRSTEKRPDGRLNIFGKDDAGEEYVARVTSGAEAQDTDIESPARDDRERSNPWDYTHSVMQANERTRKAWADNMLEDLLEPAKRVAEAGTHKMQTHIGFNADLPREFRQVVRIAEGELRRERWPFGFAAPAKAQPTK